MTLNHPKLKRLLQMAYSAEKAAAFAYQGHAGSLKDKDAIASVYQIELDEWNHRSEVLVLMNIYEIKPSQYFEIRFYLVGKLISASCYVIGWFMPFYFAGRLESGNVCEYFRMIHYFHSIGIKTHDKILYEMGLKEKEHEIYFYNQIKDHKWLPFFEKFFKWGALQSFNDIDINQSEITKSDDYCKK
jgi:hypothetical protein